MAKKVITGVILAAAIVAAIIWGPYWLLSIIVTLGVGAAAWEFAAFSKAGTFDSVVAGTGAAAIVATSAVLPGDSFLFPVMQVVFLASMMAMILVLFRPVPIETAGNRAARLVATMVYLGLAGALCIQLVSPEHAIFGRWAMLTAGVITWLNDTMAYFGGKAFGKSKMYQLISPNKTWAGSISGMFGSIGGAFGLLWLFGHFWGVSYPAWSLLGLSIVGGVLGQIGDLAESMFKRSADVKDSGNFLPGHGGMLDRIDAFLFVGPVTYLWLFVWFPVA
jgi:phosphatidate cytidylyltransferase